MAKLDKFSLNSISRQAGFTKEIQVAVFRFFQVHQFSTCILRTFWTCWKTAEIFREFFLTYSMYIHTNRSRIAKSTNFSESALWTCTFYSTYNAAQLSKCTNLGLIFINVHLIIQSEMKATLSIRLLQNCRI